MTPFKALRIHQADKATVARFDTIRIDDLSAGDVVIRVAYSSINYKDALAVSGKGRIVRGYPRVAGIDLSGVVESSSDPHYRPGDKVLVTGCNIGEALDGGYAEFARVPASAVVPLPAGLTLFEAMALGTAGFTAALALRRMLENHQAPEMGPIAKAGAGESYLRSLGADEVIDRRTLDMGSKPLESARWGGAVDNLGGDMLAYLCRTVRPWGNIACVGLAQAPTLNTTVMPLILRGVSLLGIHSVECPRPWRLAVWDRLGYEWKPRGLDTLIAPRVVPLEDVPRVCDELIAGTAIARTVVRVAGE